MHPIKQLLAQLNQQNLWQKHILLKRNDFLKHRRTVDTNVYFVLEGSVRIYDTDGADEHVIRFGYKDNLLTCLDSFITEKPSNLIIQTLKKTELKVIPKKSFMELINSSVQSRELWSELLQNLLLEQMEREQDILISSPTERYQKVLTRSPHLFQEIPNKHIASYLRMTPETFYRLKKS